MFPKESGNFARQGPPAAVVPVPLLHTNTNTFFLLYLYPIEIKLTSSFFALPSKIIQYSPGIYISFYLTPIMERPNLIQRNGPSFFH